MRVRPISPFRDITDSVCKMSLMSDCIITTSRSKADEHETGSDGPLPVIPLTEKEVAELGIEKHEVVVKYAVGDNVRIIDGPINSFTGVVEELDVAKNRVSVRVSMFGREMPVELELDQVEPVKE